jgi:hypothetical protein
MGVLESSVPFPQPAGCRAFSGAVQRGSPCMPLARITYDPIIKWVSRRAP